MTVDVSKIKAGDRVKVSLYGLPESDWLEVIGVRVLAVKMPSGDAVYIYDDREVTAHEPKDPLWWGSLVLWAGRIEPDHICTYDVRVGGYRNAWGDLIPDAVLRCDVVTVIVDAEGRTAADRARDGIEAIIAARQRNRDSRPTTDLSAALDVLDRERGAL